MIPLCSRVMAMHAFVMTMMVRVQPVVAREWAAVALAHTHPCRSLPSPCCLLLLLPLQAPALAPSIPWCSAGLPPTSWLCASTTPSRSSCWRAALVSAHAAAAPIVDLLPLAVHHQLVAQVLPASLYRAPLVVGCCRH